jgi:hypothetical protein
MRSDASNAILQKAMADSSYALSKRIAETQKIYAKVETRAYLTIEKTFIPVLDVGKEVTFPVRIINTGRTPANNVFQVTGVKMCGTGIYDSEFKQIRESNWYSQICSTLGAGQSYQTNLIFNKIFTIEDSIDVFKFKKIMFLYGILIYNDFFGESDSTFFCFKLPTPSEVEVIGPHNKAK